jgi:hypothetical protein
MPPIRRIDPLLAEYLLAHPDAALRRQWDVLRRGPPLPLGSHALAADAEWYALAARFPGRQGYLYGTGVRGLVYTYDAATDALSVELALIDGRVRP